MVGVQRQYRDPRQVTQWLCGLLIATAFVCVISGLSRLADWHVYVAMNDETEPSEIATIVHESMLRYSRLAALMNLVVAGTIVLFVNWTHLANSNIHALGGQSIRFTPVWAVGWYLVPIANVWMPYQVMSEIWRISRNSMDARSETTSRLLQWWWFCWLAYSVGGNLHWFIPVHGLEAVVLSRLLSIVSLVFALVSAGVALVLIKRICAFQVRAADRLLSAVFA